MKKWLLAGTLFSTLLLTTINSSAESLSQVYQQALSNDPTYQAARQNWFSQKENYPIAFSTLLPFVDLSGETGRNINDRLSGGLKIAQGRSRYFWGTDMSLKVTQSFLNVQAWMSLKNVNDSVKAAAATFAASGQSLIIRTATAYFNVLLAYDNLTFTEAEKRSVYRQLEQTQERFKVGLTAITDVYQAQARYDSITAQDIAARNNLANRVVALREITGITYFKYHFLREKIPLVLPQPANMDAWAGIAIKNNYSLKASHYTALAARENIKVQSAARLPVANGFVAYTFSHQTAPSIIFAGGAANIPTRNKNAEIGVNFDIPIFQGGGVFAKTRQAEYQYQQADYNQEESMRSVTADATTSYLGVMSGISQIRAGKQAIISNESSVKSTLAAYQVGTQTMVDVLNVQSALFQAQNNYSISRYQYLLDILTLKQAAGTLTVADLNIMNRWLSKQINVRPALRKIGTRYKPPKIILPAPQDSELGATTVTKSVDKKEKDKEKVEKTVKKKVEMKKLSSEEKPKNGTKKATPSKDKGVRPIDNIKKNKNESNMSSKRRKHKKQHKHVGLQTIPAPKFKMPDNFIVT